MRSRSPSSARRPTSRCRPTDVPRRRGVGRGCSPSRPLHPLHAVRARPARRNVSAPRRPDRAQVRGRAAVRGRQRVRRRRRPHPRAAGHASKRVIVAAWTAGARERLAALLADHGLEGRAQGRELSPRRWRCRATSPRSPCSASSRASRRRSSPSSASRTSSATAWCARAARRAAPPTSSPRRPACRSAISSCTPTTASAASPASRPSPRSAPRTTASRSPMPAATSSTCRSRTSSCCRATARTRSGAQLDRLGGVAWQSRKARLKKRLREIAAELIKIAALRQLKEAPADRAAGRRLRRVRRPLPLRGDRGPGRPASRPCSADLGSGRPMDRLVCGDVGFGKTEVALRAAFVAAMTGLQVAVVVPTTLLARQHFKTFASASRACRSASRRPRAWSAPRSWPRSRTASRTAPSTSSSARTRCSARRSSSRASACSIVDEEQHFGVAHKERLKQLREDVHVLTLSATPIPRTLQLALDRRARAVADHHAAGRPPRRAHLHLAVRSGHPARGAAARALPRRPDASTSCRASPTSTRSPSSCAEAVPELQGRARPRPAGADRARGRHDRLLRRQVRRAAVDRDRRVRPRHAQRQHADRAPRRHVRPGPALPAARPRRPLEDARLCLLHHAARPEADRGRREAPEGAAVARHARRRLLARLATISTSAAPATCSARSSPATSARSASSSTSRCWRRRSRP